jgi:hypothetical protein
MTLLDSADQTQPGPFHVFIAMHLSLPILVDNRFLLLPHDTADHPPWLSDTDRGSTRQMRVDDEATQQAFVACLVYYY